MIKDFRRSIFFVGLLILSACAPHSRLILSPPTTSVEVVGAHKEEILKKLRTSLPQTFRCSIGTEIRSRGSREEFRQALTFKQPAFLRLEAFATGANALVFLAIADESKFRAILPAEKKVLHGPPSGRALATVTQIPLSPLELMFWLRGSVSPEFLTDSSSLLYREPSGRMFLQSAGPFGREVRAVVEGDENPFIRELSLALDGQGALRSSYSFALGVPSRISFDLPDISGELQFNDCQSNVTLKLPDEKLFYLHEPAKFEVEEIR